MKQILSILFTIIVTTSCTAEYGEDIPYKSVDVDYTFNLAVDGRSYVPLVVPGVILITFVSVRADITTRPPDRKSVPDDIVFFRLFKSARLVTVLPIDAPAFAIKAKIRLPEEPLINMGIERFDIAEGGKYLNDMAFPFEASKINAFRSYKLFS